MSYIFNCGKRRALKHALDCHEILDPLNDYGTLTNSSLEVSEPIIEAACKLLYVVYGDKDFVGTLDEFCCHLFKRKKSDIRSLPPTLDALSLHPKRVL